MCTCPLCHVIYHSCDKGSWRQLLLSTTRCCNVWGRNLITGLTSAASPRVDVSSTCKVGQKLGVSLSPSVDMLPFGVTIPAMVPHRSEVPEGLMNYPVYSYSGYSIKPGFSQDPLISDHSAQDTKWDLEHYFFFAVFALCSSRLLPTFYACCLCHEG